MCVPAKSCINIPSRPTPTTVHDERIAPLLSADAGAIRRREGARRRRDARRLLIAPRLSCGGRPLHCVLARRRTARSAHGKRSRLEQRVDDGRESRRKFEKPKFAWCRRDRLIFRASVSCSRLFSVFFSSPRRQWTESKRKGEQPNRTERYRRRNE